MTASDQSSTGLEPLGTSDSRAGSKRQLIGVLLAAYGAIEGAIMGWLFLMGLQASDGSEPLLLPFFLMFSIPCCVAFVGQGLARDRRWAYWASLFLPIVVVPLGAWWIMNPRGRPERLWVEFLGPLGGSAFLALGTVALSAALLFTSRRAEGGGQPGPR